MLRGSEILYFKTLINKPLSVKCGNRMGCCLVKLLPKPYIELFHFVAIPNGIRTPTSRERSMITKEMSAALNKQIKEEFYASHLYLSMSAYADNKNLKGFAHWLRLQADEEREHALKIMDYLLSIGEPVTLDAIDKPPTEFGTPKTMFEAVLKHEQKVTGLIHKLFDQAVAEKDYRSQIMLQWFVTEQIEEEEQAQEILDKIEAVGEKSTAVWWIDKELGSRSGD